MSDIDPLPDWVTQTPNLPSLHTMPSEVMGGIQLPTLPQLGDFVQMLIDAILGWVAKALGSIEVLGWKPFEEIVEWADRIQGFIGGVQAFFGSIDLQGSVEAAREAFVRLIVEPLLSLPGIGPIIEALTGIADGDLPDLEAWARKLLGPDSPLNAGNLFGQVLPNRLGMIPGAQIGWSQPELLTNPKFENVKSLSGQDVWFYDEIVGHDGAGSAYVDADGLDKELLSNYITVSEEQKLTASVWVCWENLVATGKAIEIGFNCYNEFGAPIGYVFIDRFTNPSGTVGWSQLKDSLVDLLPDTWAVRLRLRVTDAATAGRVWFDDGSVRVAAGLLNRIRGEVDDAVDRIQGTIDTIANAVGLPGAGHTLNALLDALRAIPQGNISGLSSALNAAGQGIRDTIVQALGGSGTGHTDADVFNALINIPLGAVNGLVGALNQAAQNLNDFVDKVKTGADHSAGTVGWTPEDAFQSLWQLMQRNVDNAARIAELEALITGQDNYGNSASDDFNREGVGPGPDWWTREEGTVADGHVETDGNSLVWTPSGNQDHKVLGRYLLQKSETNYQKVQGLLSTTPETGTNFYPQTYLIARANDAMTDYVFAALDRDGVNLGYCRNGTEHTWQRLTGGTVIVSYKPVAGDIWELVAGTSNSEHEYRVKRNNSTLISFTDAGQVAAVDDSHHNWGWALHGRRRGSVQGKPGGLAIWTGADNTPAQLVGSVFSAYRATGSGASFNSGTNRDFPSNFFDTVEYISRDMSWDGSGLTVTRRGMYVVESRVEFDSAIGINMAFMQGIKVNGAIRKLGYAGAAQAGLFNTSHGGRNWHDTWLIYLNPGDRLTMGYGGSLSNNGIGVADGSYSFLTISRLSDSGMMALAASGNGG